MAAISKARKAAFQILLSVERGHAHSDELLRGKGVNALVAPDRNLTTALVLGVLRWQIKLDEQLHVLLKKPNAKLDAEVLIALRMGAFQLLYMDRIPARAAIDESVELAKQAGHKFASKMVNAVLRKLSGAPQVNALEESAAGLAAAHAHPQWMVERWVARYGLETARAICMHGQKQPVLTVRVADADAELVRDGVKLAAGKLLTVAREVTGGDVTATKAFAEGRVRLQDEGSQLVAELASAFGGDAERVILDACAAPGGKTMILADRHPAARVVACEWSEHRLAQMQGRFGAYGERIECRLGDAAAITENGVFDLVLADVPCSGTGTLGRNPEIRHRLKLEELERQAERQRAILAGALRAVRVGGFVVYSTCSLEPEENERVVEAVLASGSARIVSIESRVDALERNGVLILDGAERLRGCVTAEGMLRLMPGVFDSDGFFVAVLERMA